MKSMYMLLMAFCVSGCVYERQPPACPNVFVPAHLNCSENECVVVRAHYERQCNKANDHSGYYYDPK